MQPLRLIESQDVWLKRSHKTDWFEHKFCSYSNFPFLYKTCTVFMFLPVAQEDHKVKANNALYYSMHGNIIIHYLALVQPTETGPAALSDLSLLSQINLHLQYYLYSLAIIAFYLWSCCFTTLIIRSVSYAWLAINFKFKWILL